MPSRPPKTVPYRAKVAQMDDEGDTWSDLAKTLEPVHSWRPYAVRGSDRGGRGDSPPRGSEEESDSCDRLCKSGHISPGRSPAAHGPAPGGPVHRAVGAGGRVGHRRPLPGLLRLAPLRLLLRLHRVARGAY